MKTLIKNFYAMDELLSSENGTPNIFQAISQFKYDAKKEGWTEQEISSVLEDYMHKKYDEVLASIMSQYEALEDLEFYKH